MTIELHNEGSRGPLSVIFPYALEELESLTVLEYINRTSISVGLENDILCPVRSSIETTFLGCVKLSYIRLYERVPSLRLHFPRILILTRFNPSSFDRRPRLNRKRERERGNHQQKDTRIWSRISSFFRETALGLTL